MKKLYLALTLVLVCLTANAQNYIFGLDELELLGTWNVTGSFGTFNGQSRGAMQSVQFADGNYTKFTYLDGTETVDVFFKGYWVTVAKTDKYFLHLLPWNGNESIVNFRIKEFADGSMTLTTYDGNGTIILAKDTSAGVNVARMDAPKGKAYGLNGTELPTPDAATGIVIRDGRKVVQ